MQRLTLVDPAAGAPPPAGFRSGGPSSTPPSFVHPSLGSRCDSCRFRNSCLGCAFRSVRGPQPLLVGYRRHLVAGEVLYHAGAKCSLVHVAQSGFFKTVVLADDGTGQIAAFHMPGDVLGIEGLHSGVHRCDAIAITEASVCVISRARLLEASVENRHLSAHLLGVLCDEIGSDHGTMLLLGSRSAEERVAGFIVGLSDRLSARGFGSSEIGLWMSREEIGSFLGLELETVSRVLSSLVRRRLIAVDRRDVRIRDLRALREAATGGDAGDDYACRRQARRERAAAGTEAGASVALEEADAGQ